MGVLSWLRLRRSADKRDERRSLVRAPGPVSDRLEEIRKAAAADLAEIAKDNKYFSPDSPGNGDDGI
jgi:hypothetical protein